MSVIDPYSQYMDIQVKTASPGKLLIMAHDAAIRFGRAAQENMRERKLDRQSANIAKMQNILVELISSLDPKADRQLAANLDALYTYMFDRLTYANIRDNEKALEEVIGIFAELRSTWAEADMTARSGSRQGVKAA